MINLDAIEAAAKKATPGRWTLECLMTQIPVPAAVVVMYHKAAEPGGRTITVALTGSRLSSELDNWRYVAEVGPEIILELIAELRGFRAKAEEGR